MGKSDLRITLIQSNLTWEDKRSNLKMFSDKILSIHDDTDLIILPEMFSTGFTMNASALAESMNGESVGWLKKMALQKNCVVTGSLIIEENGKFYNRLIWMQPDGFEYYDKRHLFSLAGEEKTYHPGNSKTYASLKGWRILPLICYDLRFPVWSRRRKKSDYDLLIYVANWPERRVSAWNNLLIARAIENQCYVAGLNRIGNDGHEIFHSGDSAVIDFAGKSISKINSPAEDISTITLHKEPLEDFRNRFSFIEDADDFEIKS